MALDVAEALRTAGWQFTQEVAQHSVTFSLTHAELSDWPTPIRVVITESPSIQINVLTVSCSDTRLSWEKDRFRWRSVLMTKASVKRLVAHLEEMKAIKLHLAQTKVKCEAITRHFNEQKTRELGDAAIPDWMNVDIHVSGEVAGRYRVTFDAGSVLERLSAAQAMTLAALLETFEDQESNESAAH